MMQLVDAAYRFDPADPRSPSQEQWDRMSADERARVLAMLPAEVPWEQLDVVSRKERAERHACAETTRADIMELKLAEALAEIERLGLTLNDVLAREEAERRAVAEAERATAEAERATAEAARADAAELKLAEALARIEQLEKQR